jgi:hypothetical protein
MHLHLHKGHAQCLIGGGALGRVEDEQSPDQVEGDGRRRGQLLLEGLTCGEEVRAP